MFDPWTSSVEEAIAAQERHQAAGPDGPIFQWTAARRIEAQKDAAEGGDGFAVLACIRSCVTSGLVAPEWLAYAFNRHYDQVLSCRVRSWDEAFGKPYSGKDIKLLRQRRELRFAVYNKVLETLNDHPQVIGEKLFAQVAEHFGIKKTLCAELYYEAKRLLA